MIITYLVVGLTALSASVLTFFSGFGLGTILMPVMLIFFPLPVAIAITAVVHLLNNLFKLGFVYPNIQKSVVLQFGITALAGAIGGAYLLIVLGDLTLYQYSIGTVTKEITLVKIIIGLVMIWFSLSELIPSLNKEFHPKYLPLGGLLTGFFGGLSGHQGALRSSFLVKCNLTKEQFIATGVVIACLIDAVRIPMYYFFDQQDEKMNLTMAQENWPLLVVAVGCSFAGVIAGNYLLKKVTDKVVKFMVAFMVMLFALALISGLV